jgi:hypothetical protein
VRSAEAITQFEKQAVQAALAIVDRKALIIRLMRPRHWFRDELYELNRLSSK